MGFHFFLCLDLCFHCCGFTSDQISQVVLTQWTYKLTRMEKSARFIQLRQPFERSTTEMKDGGGKEGSYFIRQLLLWCWRFSEGPRLPKQVVLSVLGFLEKKKKKFLPTECRLALYLLCSCGSGARRQRKRPCDFNRSHNFWGKYCICGDVCWSTII